jgi:hypothetical protein
MDLMEPEEACFVFRNQVTLRLGCFASCVEDSSRIFASSASFASFEASFGRPGSRPPSHRILFAPCHSCLLNVCHFDSLRLLLPAAALHWPRLQLCMNTSHGVLLVFRHRHSLNAFPSASPLGGACFCLLLLEPEFGIPACPY